MSKKAVVKIGSDVEEAKSGINQVTQQLNTLAKKTKDSSFSKFVSSFSALGKSVEFATGTIKKINQSIKENIELAQKQQKAEVQLQAAAKNNPYLTDASVVQLKNYASELQSISTIGDEELLPMMSQLAAAGRTQTEIQDIMSAALDLSASGMMSMDSAVSALNGTLQGNVGTLGKQVSGLKDLTAEELKSGKAIEIIKKQFDGMSESISEQTGGWQKYKNSIGDFKEALGTGWANLQNSVGNVLSGFFDSITNKISAAKKEAEEFRAKLNLIAVNDSDNSTSATLQSEIDLLQKENKEYEKQLQALQTTKKEFIQGEKDKQKELEQTKEKLNELHDKYFEENYDGSSFRTQQEEFAYAKLLEEKFAKLHPEFATIEEDLEKQKKAVKSAGKEWQKLQEDAFNSGNSIESLNERLNENNSRLDELNKKLKENQKIEKDKSNDDSVNAEIAARNKLRIAYDETIQKKKDEIALRRQAGASISEEEEAQMLLNTAMDAYVKMMGSPEFAGNRGTYIHEVDARKAIQTWAETVTAAEKAKEAIKELEKESDNLVSQANSFIGSSESLLSVQIETEVKTLEKYINTLDETSEEYTALTQKKIKLEELFTDVVNKENEERTKKEKEHIAQLMTDMAQYIDQFANITNGITALVRQNNEQENEEALTALSEQYTDGIISYEEYCEKKKELDKKAAQEEYKLKMWEWTASFLQATANIAQGVAAALTQTPPASYIMAALTAATGAIQIATIMASKPKPPSFATGGIVPGNSYSGDRVQANVNSGEMILNAQQQANLWKAANSISKGGAVVNMPVTIENNASDIVSAQPEINKNGLTLIVSRIVKSEMAKGVYNESMNIAQSRANGISLY